MPDPFDENSFIEMPDGSSKPIVNCSPAELRTEAKSRKLQGQKLIDEAHWLNESADRMERNLPSRAERNAG